MNKHLPSPTFFIVCVLLLTLTPNLQAQKSHSIDWIFGIGNSGNVEEQALAFSEIDSNTEFKLNAEQQRKYNFKFGLNLNKELKNGWFFKTGLQVSEMGYNLIDEDNMEFGRMPNEAGEWIPDPNIDPVQKISKSNLFVEIPINLRYEFESKKLTPFIEFGLNPMIHLLTLDLEYNTNSFTTVTSSNAKPFHLIGMAGIGANYSLKSGHKIFAQANYSHQLNNLHELPEKVRLNNFGMEVGLRRMMRK